MSEISMLNHHDYPRLDVECCCSICTQWRSKRVEYEKLRRLVRPHSRSCFCWKCCRLRELQIEYLAIQNKRDIYCELSWHASHVSGGLHFMNWLQTELLTSRETPGWWAKSSPCFSLGHWVYLYKQAVTALCSGVSGMAA